MRDDLRDTDVYREIEALYRTLRQPGTGRICDAAELHVSPDGRTGVFAGYFMDGLAGTPHSRVCLIDLSAPSTVRVVTHGPNTDRLPKFSPCGQHVAFLSDRGRPGDFQLYLLNPLDGVSRAVPHVDGWIEYLHWSPDGTRILLGVAGHGADTAGGQGAVTSNKRSESRPTWMPAVDTGAEHYRWRRVWIYELATDCVRAVDVADLNVWEAAWCGNDAITAIVSSGPGEGLWYTARLHVIDVTHGRSTEIYVPEHQLASPAASPSGKQVAIIEALCSDRGIAAGDVRVVDVGARTCHEIDTQGIDVTYLEWRSDRTLLIAGHRGPETVVATCDVSVGTCTEVWSSQELTSGGRYIAVAGFSEAGDCALLTESFLRAPQIGLIQNRHYRTVYEFDSAYARWAASLAQVTPLSWKGRDGLQIQGWLLRPQGDGPHPLILNVHGGPVWHWRPTWLGRSAVHLLMLLKQGYAIFLPNPRGSAGRGQHFARKVLGDMGGEDTHDYLCGIDELVRARIADPKRLGVMGASYGGFMTAWLVTQDQRFAAAVAVAPITNHVTEQLISNIPHFTSLFLADRYDNPAGKYFERSPIMHAHEAKTPTLNICGALDRCTPPEEAVQFHNALLSHGVKSALVTYPQEGHGVRQLPALIDYAARVVGWFQEHMPA